MNACQYIYCFADGSRFAHLSHVDFLLFFHCSHFMQPLMGFDKTSLARLQS